jgi:hypothetical protein
LFLCPRLREDNEDFSFDPPLSADSRESAVRILLAKISCVKLAGLG